MALTSDDANLAARSSLDAVYADRLRINATFLALLIMDLPALRCCGFSHGLT